MSRDVITGDITPEGIELRPPANHFDDKAEDPSMLPPDDLDVYNIYVSPSIIYSGLEVYAPATRYTVHKYHLIINHVM